MFYLVTLTLKFHLLLKNLNLEHYTLREEERKREDYYMLTSMCISCGKTFQFHIDLLTLTLKFSLLIKNLTKAI